MSERDRSDRVASVSVDRHTDSPSHWFPWSATVTLEDGRVGSATGGTSESATRSAVSDARDSK